MACDCNYLVERLLLLHGVFGIVGLGLGLGLELVCGWIVVMHTYLYYFPLSLLLSPGVNRCIFPATRPPHLHLTTSEVMVIVWRLRGNII